MHQPCVHATLLRVYVLSNRYSIYTVMSVISYALSSCSAIGLSRPLHRTYNVNKKHNDSQKLTSLELCLYIRRWLLAITYELIYKLKHYIHKKLKYNLSFTYLKDKIYTYTYIIAHKSRTDVIYNRMPHSTTSLIMAHYRPTAC